MTTTAMKILIACGALGLAACQPGTSDSVVATAPAAAEAATPPPAMNPAPMPAAQMAPVQPELAKALNADIDREGAKAVIASLDRDATRFKQVSDAIATADPAWLTIALRLREGSDPGTSETLRISAARALPEAPERVLALIGHGYTLDDLCTSPFIEPEPGVAEAYAAKTLAALQSITDPALKATVDDCARRVTLPE